MYIDESGNTAYNLEDGASKFLVLTGCIIHEDNRHTIETQFRAIKKKYYQNEDIEVKSNFLRNANPDIAYHSPLKLYNRETYDNLEHEIASFLKDLPIQLISVVVDKHAYWAGSPNQKPYNAAYLLLLEAFQKFLEEKNKLGICVIDPREGQVNKSFLGDELENIHHSARWSNSKDWIECPRVVERLLYAPSDRTIGIQIADLFCYPIFHVFEYNKLLSEYWRCWELSYPKLLADGLKIFPEESKKGLRTMSETHF
ncbi:MAG: hypothetical protein A2V81_01280 [Candidatus Abawacabacteria bacterium RBG_16_42_10]|uniref:DUF3800 domain-containing protein n=1 Tax=Candidatus Abawacabacteria bacterium RBG_16_42_10 TaxID=1817814 RepID=A0A1F4XLJ6_9BACT|nr:MAG: hypothetical protein A2V81_01280 [Candidatus Abawacabacteria bacterium RBG_16_42_10]